jgi:hypothetical protein
MTVSSPGGHVLLVQREALVDTFGARVEQPHYRPDLYPEQLTFKIDQGRVEAAILDGRCLHAMLILEDSAGEVSLLKSLALFSGIEGWSILGRDDPLVGEHFPLFDTSGPKNTFYASNDRSALALVQVGTPLGPVVVWLQTSGYPARLEAYRRGQSGDG